MCIQDVAQDAIDNGNTVSILLTVNTRNFSHTIDTTSPFTNSK